MVQHNQQQLQHHNQLFFTLLFLLCCCCVCQSPTPVQFDTYFVITRNIFNSQKYYFVDRTQGQYRARAYAPLLLQTVSTFFYQNESYVYVVFESDQTCLKRRTTDPRPVLQDLDVLGSFKKYKYVGQDTAFKHKCNVYESAVADFYQDVNDFSPVTVTELGDPVLLFSNFTQTVDKSNFNFPLDKQSCSEPMFYGK